MSESMPNSPLLRIVSASAEATARPVQAPAVVRAAWRGIVFDMGDVLFDATAWRRWLLQLLSRLGLHATYRSLFRVWEDDYLDAVHRGDRRYGEALTAFLHSIGLSRGQVDEVLAASAARKRQLEAAIRPFPGVRGTLERLRKCGFRMGVLSDSESSAASIRKRLESLGLAEAFAAIVSSVDLGCTKPHALCYQKILADLDLSPAQAAFVGHDIQELAGARRRGMPTCAFNWEPGAEADFYVQRFDDLALLAESRFAGRRVQAGAA